jgi:hypothetical protein
VAPSIAWTESLVVPRMLAKVNERVAGIPSACTSRAIGESRFRLWHLLLEYLRCYLYASTAIYRGDPEQHPLMITRP